MAMVLDVIEVTVTWDVLPESSLADMTASHCLIGLLCVASSLVRLSLDSQPQILTRRLLINYKSLATSSDLSQ